ncbi:T9SS type B sorting domain-containing protein [Flavobacterium sp. ST-75]|uniref:T9SS type B sorting domain-containing protein n=1 Tax=Flavobacterium rhizophilum TaxID=3163296 RepID=A0ABW8Y8Z4_9FLAO
MKKIFILLLFTITIHAQEYNIWYFGGNAGLDFNGGVPVAFTDGQLYSPEGSASIADANGELIFYTNGETVWNKNHEIMQNGQELFGHSSSVQSSLIVQQPQSQNIYIIFTTSAIEAEYGLRYSLVDMEHDGGLGAITQKNILLNTPTTEALTATWHSNGEDIWVVAHEYDTSLFTAYLVTANGVMTNPVISDIGFDIEPSGQACLKLSPDGSKLALSRFRMENGTELFDFDTSTGIVSNPVTVTTTSDYYVEFSASGDVLYVSTTVDLLSRKIYQYNLLADIIPASGIEIYNDTLSPSGLSVGALQRGPDDKIYVAIRGRRFLSVIHQPDVIGVDCDFEENGLSLGGIPLIFSTAGLPNTILSPLRIDLTNPSCIGEPSAFSFSSSGLFSNIHWDFGDGSTSQESNPLHTYQQAGNYTVRFTAEQNGVVRSSQAVIEIAPLPSIGQPDDMWMCEESAIHTAVFNLATQNAPILDTLNSIDYTVTYHLSEDEAEAGAGSLSTNFSNTSNPQKIYARVEDINSGCYATTSFDLIVSPKPEIVMPDNYTLCKNASVTLTAPQGLDGYIWSTGETTRSITVDSAGVYILSVIKEINGILCENSKEITVDVSDVPFITQVITSDWTTNNNIISVMTSGGGSYEYSLDGITYQDSPQFYNLESGLYTVYVRDRDGCGIASKEVTLLMYPKFFTPNGDGINETWRIKYAYNEPNMVIHIFDRYGKKITSITGDSQGWNGTYDGKDLPATDYWFIAERQDGRLYKGHFSILR